MNRILFFVLILMFSVLAYHKAYSQCTPDPGCNDVGNPGEMCPEVLPPATVNLPYSQVVTIILRQLSSGMVKQLISIKLKLQK